MTVATEARYAERSWTGVETSFTPGFRALDLTHVSVKYRNSQSVVSDLTRGVHFNTTVDSAGNVTITPLSLPQAPGMLLITRRTPAVQETDFANLETFDPAVHTRLHDAAAMRDAELFDEITRNVRPYTVDYAGPGIVDFGAYRVRGATPVADADFATRGYVLQITGVLQLQAYVDQAAASAAAAGISAAGASTSATSSATARDKAQQWAENPEDAPVQIAPNKFSAFHWAQKAEDQAIAAATSALALANPDYGFIAAAPTETRDYGSIV